MNFELDWHKMDGLIPAIVQDDLSGRVLMLGYMNEEALNATRQSGRVTFFSRSKRRLWMKGESSGHFLLVRSIAVDCDGDSLLILAEPQGAACHLGTTTCFGAEAPEPKAAALNFLSRLDALIADRHEQRPAGSYTTQLFEAGVPRMAQKVGEEGLETALAAVCKDDEELSGEAADLVFHLLALLRARGLSLADIVRVLERRHAKPGD